MCARWGQIMVLPKVEICSARLKHRPARLAGGKAEFDGLLFVIRGGTSECL